MMQLSAWRDAVSYGAYLQPIHLQVAGPSPAAVSISAVQKLTSESAESSRNPSNKPTKTLPNETSGVQQPPEASTDLQATQNEALSTDETASIIVIPPFASECLNDDDQMVLNVGGPVWAMDWLMSKPAANAAAVAAALVNPNQKKSRRPSAASKKTKKAALKGKENNQVDTREDADGETTAAFNSSAEREGGSKLEWRFLALATHPPCQVEDGKVVKATPPDHYYDAPESARNLIQIWAVPVQRPKVSGTGQLKREQMAEKRLVKPRMVYAIDHESGVAWDLQWCPLVKKFPKTTHRENMLGVLAACFGDGSMRVFEIPKIPEERLQAMQSDEEERLVEKNIPIVVARLPRLMQLSVQWSPHSWNILLTGGSDGSVSLWNIKSAVNENDSLGNDRAEPEPIEPQRRFQDADTIGKQEAFDWGCGWVAIRAVAWSPFDEHLFATTGNDSVFKVWDVREPRVCLRSHRIRSTWGLALQWMGQTSVQISGDQGSVYMYDILSGSYQKLHFHPQIDSPVWDLQFARRGAVPLLVSSCTSGSIRAAPAKKLYRAPQNCVEICRLSGEKDSSIDKPFKSLTVSFEKHSVLGSADSVSPNTREFCERDAALHRLRLSSITPGDYPCFLAAGGHAGLVILFEMQEMLDTLIPTYFLPPSKKIGRPKKIFATVGGHHGPKKVPTKPSGAAGALNAGRKARTLGSFAKAKGMHTALSKYKKKSLGNGTGKVKMGLHANAQKKSFIQGDEEVEVDESVEEDEEPEFEEDDEEEEESDLSLVMDDCSDDDRISVSDDIAKEEEEEAATNENLEEARLMKEYQLDLSEEDAILLAIQMSTEPTQEKQPAPAIAAVLAAPESRKPAKRPRSTGSKAGAATKMRKKTVSTPRAGRRSSNDIAGCEDALVPASQVSTKVVEDSQPATEMSTESAQNNQPAAASAAVSAVMEDKKPAKPSRSPGSKARAGTKTLQKTVTNPCAGRSSSKGQADIMSEKDVLLPTGPSEEKLLATQISTEPAQEIQPVPTNTAVPAALPGKKPLKRPRRTWSKAGAASKTRSSNGHAGIFSEDDVLLSTGPLEEKLLATAELAQDTQRVAASAAVPAVLEDKNPAKRPRSTEAATKTRKKTTATPRAGRRTKNDQAGIVSEGGIILATARLEEKLSATAESAQDNQSDAVDAAVPAALQVKKPAKRPRSAGSKGAAAKKCKKKTTTPCAGQRSSNDEANISEGDVLLSTPLEEKLPAIEMATGLAQESQAAAANAAVSAAVEDKKPAKRPRSIGSKPGATPKTRKKNGGRHSRADIMSEEDALLLALTISEIEY